MEAREAMERELLSFCGVAATAVSKHAAGRISEDELGHLVQMQIRLAGFMVEEAMQHLGAKVGTGAFVDLVDFPGSIVHLFAGGATADGAADRVIQTLQRALAKDAAGAMIRNLLETISFDRVLAACLVSHMQHGPPALLPRTLNVVQLLAAVGGDLGRRFASDELDLIATIISLFKTPPPIVVRAEQSVVGAKQSGEGEASATDLGIVAEWALHRQEVLYRASAALINLALVVPELRDTLTFDATIQKTVAEFYNGGDDSATTVALVYVSTLACGSEKRKNALLGAGFGKLVTQCLDPNLPTGIRLRALLALRNLVCGSKVRQRQLLKQVPGIVGLLEACSPERTLRAVFFGGEDSKEREVRKEAEVIKALLVRVLAQQGQIDILQAELSSLRAKALQWAQENHREKLAREAAAAAAAGGDVMLDRGEPAVDSMDGDGGAGAHRVSSKEPAQPSGRAKPSSTSPSAAACDDGTEGDELTPSRNASTLMELAECSIEEASATEKSAAARGLAYDESRVDVLSPRRRILPDSRTSPGENADGVTTDAGVDSDSGLAVLTLPLMATPTLPLHAS